MTSSTSTTCATTVLWRALLVGLVLAFLPLRAAAQDSAVDGGGPLRLGPLGVRSSLSWQTAYHDNVFRSADRPVSDMVSTLGARTSARGQLRRLGFSAGGRADWVRYDALVDERGANLGASARLEALFNRVAPYVSSSYDNTRRRLNPEIDTRPRTSRSAVTAGSAFNLGGKTSVDISAGRSFVTYDSNAVVDGVNLGAALNRRVNHFAASLREEITPLTRITLSGEMSRNLFDASSSRNADHVRLTAGVQSSGFFNGSARVGLRILKPRNAMTPESRGLFVGVGTGFSIRERVQVGLDAQRDVAPSYRADVDYYEFYGYGVSIAYAIRRSFQLSAQVHRRRADYQALEGAPSLPDVYGVDDEMRYEAGIRYQLGRSVGMDVSSIYSKRTSRSASRRFNSLSVSAGASYAF